MDNRTGSTIAKLLIVVTIVGLAGCSGSTSNVEINILKKTVAEQDEKLKKLYALGLNSDVYMLEMRNLRDMEFGICHDLAMIAIEIANGNRAEAEAKLKETEKAMRAAVLQAERTQRILDKMQRLRNTPPAI